MAFNVQDYGFRHEDIMVNQQTGVWSKETRPRFGPDLPGFERGSLARKASALTSELQELHAAELQLHRAATFPNHTSLTQAGDAFPNQRQMNAERVAAESPLRLGLTLQDSEYHSNALAGVGFGQPEENSLLCYHSQPQPLQHCPLQTIPQQYCDVASYPGACALVPFPYQRIAPHFTQEPQYHPYPKPIYSYSILIFMALKNSKAGSLPVSEIYNFMTEHFPYFKSAPDGWKNSVRHNLSLNKCFEKVENKGGGSSRKGCLWALNPAKIQKMQEELHKWRRKDPSAVRKSMAKPDELDRLIGDTTDNMRSAKLTLPPLNPRTLKSPHHPRSLGHPPPSPNRPQPHSYGQLRRQVGASRDCRQKACPSHSYVQAGARARGAETSPVNPDQTPIVHTTSTIGCQLLTEHAMVLEMEDVLMDGDASSDIDALNPSLVDFELQGNLWEELKDDSLTPDHLVSTATSPQSPSFFPFYWNSCPLETSDGTISPTCPEPTLGDLQLTDVYSTYTDLDSKSSYYLNSKGSTPVSLM